MAQAVMKIRVFISCPGDVESEKEIAKKICAEVNRDSGRDSGIVMESFEWKKDVIPYLGPRPQEEINRQVGEYDVHVGIMWKKFGSPTNATNPTTGQEFGSGTEEELYTAIEQWKKNKLPLINMFFKRPPSPAPWTAEDFEQFNKVIAFRDSLMKEHHYWVVDYADEKDFEDKIRHFLNEVVNHSERFEKTLQYKIPSLAIVPAEPQSYPEVKNYIPHKVTKLDQLDTTKPSFLTEENRKELLGVIQNSPRIVLLGEAGMGKSFELRRIANQLPKYEAGLYPILVSLNKYVQQELVNYLPEIVKQVPVGKIVLILDGLDEVEAKNRNGAIRQIELYAQKNAATKILVSCRNNLHQAMEGFEAYALVELSGRDIEEYIDLRLRRRSVEFYRQVFDVGVQDLLENPFYLGHLVKVFIEKNAIPKRKADIIGIFIDITIKLDQNKYRTTIIDFAEKKRAVLKTLERLSLTMETMGRNYLAQDEFLTVIPDEVERDVIKHSGLLKKNESDPATWQFEHNNFQEYLAALVLSRQTLITIKEFTAFKPDFKKTKPSWLNTLSFLFSLVENNSALFIELLDWVSSTEQELLVRFEPGRLDLSSRIEIFKRIFEDYKKKGIWIDHIRFQYKELARFAESDEIVHYLLGEIKASTNEVVAANATYILQFMEIPVNARDEAKQILLDIVLDPTKQSSARARALNTLTERRLASEDVTQMVVPSLRQSDDAWIRFSLYYYLHSFDLQNDYVDVFIEGIPYIRHEMSHINKSEVRLGDEGYHLKIGLKKVTAPAAVIKLLEYFRSQPKDTYLAFFEDDLSIIVKNAATAYEKEISIYEVMFSLFLELVEEYHEKEASALLFFFDQTKTRAKAFEEIYRNKDSIPDWYIPLATIADDHTIESFIDIYLAGNLTDDDVRHFRNFMGWKNGSLYDLFQQRLNERTGNKFELPKARDYETERKVRFANDVNILFDQAAFIEAIELIYVREGKQSLTSEDLLELRTKNWQDPYYSDIAMDTLRDLVEKQVYAFEEVREKIAHQWNWDYFVIVEIHRFMSHGRTVELTVAQKEFIQQWCLSKLAKVDFKTALRKNENGGASTSHLAVILWFFLRKLDLPYPKNILLDMLSFDWGEDSNSLGIGYLEERLQAIEIATRILENLKNGSTTDDVLSNYLDFCRRYRIKDVIPFAMHTIEDAAREQGVRRVALDTILTFPGAFELLEMSLSKVPDDFKWCLVKVLVEASSECCRSFLLELLSNGSDEEKFRASEVLIEMQDLRGLKHYIGHVKRTRRSPVIPFEGSKLNKLSKKEAIPYLLELLEVTYHEDFVQDEFHSLDGSIRSALRFIAIDNGEYDLVKESVQRFTSANLFKYPRVNFLYAFLEELERIYYVNMSERFSVEEALSMARALV